VGVVCSFHLGPIEWMILSLLRVHSSKESNCSIEPGLHYPNDPIVMCALEVEVQGLSSFMGIHNNFV